jgi:hypothetical protein
VYTVAVEPDATFFVGCDDWGFAVWAHNRLCTDVLERDLIAAGRARPGGKYQIAHLIPVSDFTGTSRSAAILGYIAKSKAALAKAGGSIDAIDNLVWAPNGRHYGTHTDKFFEYLWKDVLKPAVKSGAPNAVQDALKMLGEQLERGLISF